MFYSRRSGKGTRLERKAKEQLERQGYLVTRAAGSHGMFDLTAANKEGIRFIQVKTDRISSKELEQIRAYDNLPANATKEVWIYKNGQGFNISSISTSPFNEIVDLFLESLSLKLGDHSVAKYNTILSRFGAHISKQGVDFLKINLSQAREYLKMLYDADASAQTIAGTVSVLQSFYGFMSMHNIINQNIFDSISQPKVHEKLPEILREAEMMTFLDSVKDPLGAAITELLYATGLRTGELLQLRGQDVDHVTCAVHVRDDRGNKRAVPCTAKSLDKVRAYRDYIEKGVHGPLFLNAAGKKLRADELNEIMKRCSAGSGLNKEITPRMIRASLAVHLLDRGVDTIYQALH
jgi:site-specific recombinase XerD/Holliday junction resolvase-like predicted endonuclease